MRGTTLSMGIALLAALALAGPAAADRFADHPATPYEGPVVLPDFDGAQVDWRDFRTRITEGAQGGVSFAGRWALVQIGCGTDCTFGVAVDLADGSITPLPVSGEGFLDIVLFAEPTSFLLKATWVTGYPPSGRCMIGEYLLEGGSFRELGVVEHPVYEDCLK